MVGISELSKTVSKKTGTTQKVAREVIKAFLDTVVEETNSVGTKINLAGFGIFERRKQMARKARNPQTKKIIEVPAKEKFVFRASSKIKYKKTKRDCFALFLYNFFPFFSFRSSIYLPVIT